MSSRVRSSPIIVAQSELAPTSPTIATLFIPVGISFLMHSLAIVAALSIASPTAQRFTASGDVRVESVELSLARPSFTPSAQGTLQLIAESPAGVQNQVQPTIESSNLIPFELDLVQRAPDFEFRQPLFVQESSAPHISEAGPDRRQIASITNNGLQIVVDPLPRARRRFQPSQPPAIIVTPSAHRVGLDKKSPPDLSNNPPPAYPRIAIHQRFEGVVLLRLRIDATGKVRSVELVASSGHDVLDKSAVDAVSTWKAVPARQGGQPIDSVELLPIRFRL